MIVIIAAHGANCTNKSLIFFGSAGTFLTYSSIVFINLSVFYHRPSLFLKIKFSRDTVSNIKYSSNTSG